MKITKGNVDDRKVFEDTAIKKGLKGKCYADKGCIISKDLFIRLYNRGLVLTTAIKRNMRNYLIFILDRISKKRFVVLSISVEN